MRNERSWPSTLALDPGPAESAYVLFDPTRPASPIRSAGIKPNEQVREVVANHRPDGRHETLLAVEMIASYGMPVGREVFETCVWIGRFVEAWAGPHRLVYRQQVKLHLCASPRAKDPNVRQALLDRFGPGKAAVGRKATPGPLYGISSHLWAALGVAVYAADVPAPTAAAGA